MRLHPLTAPYRVLDTLRGLAVVIVFSVFFGAGFDGFGLWMVAGLVVVFGVATLAYQYAYYRRFEYELTDDSLDISSGVVSRQHREIPLRRVQNVDIQRNVLQRALGIAVVDFETAGGGETEASLRFVAFDEAKRLQRGVRRRAAAEAADEGEPTGDDRADETEELLFELSDEDLVLVSLVSADPRVLSVVFFVFPVVSPALPEVSGFAPGPDGLDTVVLVLAALAGTVLAVAAAWLASAAAVFTRYYGFRLTRVGDELRYERGLLQRYDGSIPLGKVQKLVVRENVLQRRFGYAGLAVETAGYAAGQSPSGGSEAAVPMADRELVLELAQSIEPFADLAVDSLPERARDRYRRRYLYAGAGVTAVLFGLSYAFGGPLAWPFWAVGLALVALAWPAGSATYRHRGYRLGADHVVTRSGFWRRETSVVPYYRVQTVIDRRTVFQRRSRWDLATVVFDTAGSLSITGGDASAIDIDGGEAARVRDEVADRLQVALAARRPAAPDGDTTPGPDAGGTVAPGEDGETADDAGRNGDPGPDGRGSTGDGRETGDDSGPDGAPSGEGSRGGEENG